METDIGPVAVLKTAVEQAFNSVVVTDASWERGGPFIVYANPAFCEMTGYRFEELLGQSPRILQGEQTDPAVIARLRDCLREGRFFSGSTINYRKDRTPYVVSWTISPIRDSHGDISHFLSIQQDITRKVRDDEERQRLTEDLRKSRDDAVAILNTFPTATLIIEADGRLGFCSANCQALLGLAPQTLEGHSWRDVLPFDPRGLAALHNHLAQTCQDQSFTVTARLPRGEAYLQCCLKEDPRNRNRRLLFIEDISELQRLRRQLQATRFQGLVGESEAMHTLYRQISDVARGDWTVVIEGETGVGKELVARAIHEASPRKAGPFIAVNSAGLSEALMTSQLFGHRKGAFTGAIADQKGFFEEAQGGTLFLDEIGDMPLSVQASLLRVVQEREIIRVGETRPRPIDVRVVAATHRNLVDEVAAGRFREDLFYRFRVARLRVPALRERKTDIPLLAEHFLQAARKLTGQTQTALSPGALRCLLAYDWPGNVRELRACVDFAVIYGRGTQLDITDLPPEIRARADLAQLMANTEAIAGEDDPQRIQTALKQSRGNRSKAAALLGMSRSTFYRRLRELGWETDQEK